MKVKEFMYLHPENKDLPIICIDTFGYCNNYDNFDDLINNGIEKDYKYINGSCQLDLDGENSFIIIFCNEDINLV